MPGLDIGHVILLAGIALIVFGPERVQEMAGLLGRTLADFRRASQGLPGSWDYPALPYGSPGGMVEREPGGMTLMEHFAELRTRLVRAAVPILVAAAVCFYFSDWILRVLKEPAGPAFQINAFGPMDGFTIRWEVALYAGLVLASPVWIYQLLAFVSPGLTPQERRFFFPALMGVAVLFVLGTAFGYELLSGMVRVMLSMFGHEVNYLPNANQYISFVVFFMLACALVFELPAVLLVLVEFGVLRPEMLRRNRKIAYFLLFVFAEVITPVADPIVAPMIVMAPLVVLYEGAIFATRWVLLRAGREPATTS